MNLLPSCIHVHLSLHLRNTFDFVFEIRSPRWERNRGPYEREDLSQKYADRSARVARYDELALDLAEAFAQNARDHWLDLLEQNDVPFAPERRLEELVDDPQVQHLDVFYDMGHSRYGSVRAAHRPVRYDGDNHSNFMPPPALGEHTQEVLVAAGLDAHDLEKLAKEGAI